MGYNAAMPAAPVKHRTVYLGIDPGKGGSLILLGRLYPVALRKIADSSEIDLWQWLLKARSRYHIERACLEKVHGGLFGSFRKPGVQMGVSSAFTFGMGYGILRALLAASGIPFTLVPPATWQKAMDCRTGGDKNISKAKAQALYPHIKVTHWNADGLLLATYCREHLAHGPT